MITRKPKKFIFSDLYKRSKYLEHVGKKFSKLTIIDFPGYVPRSDKNTSKSPCVHIKCDCGTEFITIWYHIKNRRTHSCGCIHKLYHEDPRMSSAKSMYSKLKNRNKDVELTLEQYIALVEQTCTYCGTYPSQSHRSTNCREAFIYNGIDRIDPAIGYTLENSVPCCKYCNFAKNELSVQDFKEHVKNMYTHLFLK